MHPIPPELVGLYDFTGRHLGGMYEPIMANGQLTPAHSVCLAGRPAQRLIWSAETCSDPEEWLGLVFMVPGGPTPLASAPVAVPYLVQALDAGCSVQVHAESEVAIDAVCAGVRPWLGGGRV